MNSDHVPAQTPSPSAVATPSPSAVATPSPSAVASMLRPVIAADVVVVGARCAGAATAMLLARQGHDVVLVDRYLTPHDTVSTHSIARSGVVQLSRWGLLDEVLDRGAPPITHVTFHTESGADRRRIVERAWVDHLVAPRRHSLDRVLLDGAIDAGVRVHTGVQISDVHRTPDGRIGGVYGALRSGALERFAGRFVVGADGVRSRIARSVGAATMRSRPSPGGTLYAYYGGVAWDGIEFHHADGVFAGIFPTNGGEAAVWVCTLADRIDRARQAHGSSAAALSAIIRESVPLLAERLTGARRTAPVRCALRLPNHMLAPVGPGWALVGDAGYHRDPITGHGISDAFRDAELLADALSVALHGGDEVESLAAYWRRRDEMASPIFDLTCALAAQPDPEIFNAHQRALSRAIEAEANELASWPMTDRSLTAV